MVDYYVFFIEFFDFVVFVVDYGVVFKIEDIFWVFKQFWVFDVVIKNGKYYFYFFVCDKEGIFCIGVVVGDWFEGFFIFDLEFIKGFYFIDFVIFVDDDGEVYFYFGGFWGGQLQCYQKGYDVFDVSW